jgi:hypothetical protein
MNVFGRLVCGHLEEDLLKIFENSLVPRTFII